MSRKKKKAQEELIKTHVLNLNEIRDAEVQDKYRRNRKMPKWFFIVGILLIAAGLGVSFLIAYNAREKLRQEKNKKVKDKSKLVCVSNLLNDNYKCSIHTETTYKFEGDYLVSSNVVSKSECSEVKLFENLKNDIHINSYDSDDINDSKNGLTYSFSYKSKTQVFINFELNYKRYKEDQKQKYINNYVKVPSLTSKNTYEEVKKSSEKLGALCN